MAKDDEIYIMRFKICGDGNCKVSTGIHEGLTFGKGHLDSNGYWERPCAICEQEYKDAIYQKEILAEWF